MATQQSLVNPTGNSPETNAALAVVETKAHNRPYAVLQEMNMLNGAGEIEFANLPLAERIDRFIEFRETANCNLPLGETIVLSKMAPKTTFVPLVVIPTLADCWYGPDARKIKAPEGHVVPSADFYIRLGQLAEAGLAPLFEGPNDDTGTIMYRVRYIAYLTLPDGSPLLAEDEGKDQEMYNSNGKQAHIVENTRKKAKRNAIKSLLGLKTTMPQEEFLRPWIILRPVFRDEGILADKKAMSDYSRSLLFNRARAIETRASVDIEPLRASIASAVTLHELEAIGKQIQASGVTTEQRAILGADYRAKKAALEPKPEAPAPEAPAQPAPEPTASGY